MWGWRNRECLQDQVPWFYFATHVFQFYEVQRITRYGELPKMFETLRQHSWPCLKIRLQIVLTYYSKDYLVIKWYETLCWKMYYVALITVWDRRPYYVDLITAWDRRPYYVDLITAWDRRPAQSHRPTMWLLKRIWRHLLTRLGPILRSSFDSLSEIPSDILRKIS